MAPLRERILKRGLLAAAIMAVVGYVLNRAYLGAMRSVFPNAIDDTVSVSYQGPMIFALLGFAVIAAAECVRKK